MVNPTIKGMFRSIRPFRPKGPPPVRGQPLPSSGAKIFSKFSSKDVALKESPAFGRQQGTDEYMAIVNDNYNMYIQYIYIYVHVYIYIHRYVHIYMYMDIYMYMNVYMYM